MADNKKEKKLLEKGWVKGRWWALTDSEGNLKAETSNPNEIAQFYEPGDKVYRTYETRKFKSVEVDILDHYTQEEIDKRRDDYNEVMGS